MAVEPHSEQEILVDVQGLRRVFDVSKPWLSRVIERLPKAFLTAVDDISFTIPTGETFALVGESGSGKSTVAKMVVGLLNPTSGTVDIDGISMGGATPAAEMRQLRRRFQMIFQDPYASLNPRWRVAKIISEPIRAFQPEVKEAELTEKIGELLTLVGLSPEDGGKFPHEFSGGQRQRICIARALSSNPEFIVCDEPTSALDVSVQAQILNLMKDLQDELGLTYLFISHDLSVVRHMATNIGVMYLGRLAEIAPSKELFKTAKHPYTQMLLDAIPDLDMSGRVRKPVEGEIPNPINPPPGCFFNPRCPFANDRCRKEAPKMLPLPADQGGQGDARFVACHAVQEQRI